MISWPALIYHPGDPELQCIRSQADWDASQAGHQLQVDGSDYLVDATGAVFALAETSGRLDCRATGRTLSRDEVLGLVKGHAAQAGSCCVAKLYAPTVRAAVELAAALDQT